MKILGISIDFSFFIWYSLIKKGRIKMKILVVDDELHALKDLTGCLAQIEKTSKIFSFYRSDEARAFAEQNADIDVAFLDVNMPVLNGIELAKILKKINPKINVIFCTAYSEYAIDAIRLHASGFVNKPYEAEDIKRELDNLLNPVTPTMPKVFARTFGDFDLFVDGAPVTFLRSKSKEMLAYLISKKGGTANRKELAAALFGDDYDSKTQNYLVHIYSDLVKTLKNYGIENMLVKTFNAYAVDANAFKCDLYDYDAGLPEAINAYKGEYMAQYDWAVF